MASTQNPLQEIQRSRAIPKVCVCVCVWVWLPSHIGVLWTNLNFRSEVVGVVTDDDRRKMRNEERAFVRESADAKGDEPDHHGYRMRGRAESGLQIINFQPAVEPTEEGIGQQDDIQDDIAQRAEKSGDKEASLGSHGDKEGSHGDNQPAENKEEEEEVSIEGVWQEEVSGIGFLLVVHSICVYVLLVGSQSEHTQLWR